MSSGRPPLPGRRRRSPRPRGDRSARRAASAYFTENGFDPSVAPLLPEIYRQIRDAGFDAVHVEIPTGMSVRDYRRLLDDSGLAPTSNRAGSIRSRIAVVSASVSIQVPNGTAA
jgi:hypothetical protein